MPRMRATVRAVDIKPGDRVIVAVEKGKGDRRSRRRGIVVSLSREHCLVDLGHYRESFRFEEVAKIMDDGTITPVMQAIPKSVIDQVLDAKGGADPIDDLIRELDVEEGSQRHDWIKTKTKEVTEAVKVGSAVQIDVTGKERKSVTQIAVAERTGRAIAIKEAVERMKAAMPTEATADTSEPSGEGRDDIKSKLDEVARLYNGGATYNEISAAAGIKRSVVHYAIRQAHEAGLIPNLWRRRQGSVDAGRDNPSERKPTEDSPQQSEAVPSPPMREDAAMRFRSAGDEFKALAEQFQLFKAEVEKALGNQHADVDRNRDLERRIGEIERKVDEVRKLVADFTDASVKRHDILAQGFTKLSARVRTLVEHQPATDSANAVSARELLQLLELALTGERRKST